MRRLERDWHSGVMGAGTRVHSSAAVCRLCTREGTDERGVCGRGSKKDRSKTSAERSEVHVELMQSTMLISTADVQEKVSGAQREGGESASLSSRSAPCRPPLPSLCHHASNARLHVRMELLPPDATQEHHTRSPPSIDSSEWPSD